jgi:hypothetical protein
VANGFTSGVMDPIDVYVSQNTCSCATHKRKYEIYSQEELESIDLNERVGYVEGLLEG